MRKVARGHFTAQQIGYLASVAASLLDDPVRHDDARTLAAGLLRQMQAGLPPGVAAKLRTALAADGVLDRVVATGRLVAEGHAADCVRRVVSAAAARMPREGPWLYDETLAALADEMLYSPVSDVRLYAAVAIQATPYRGPVAAALGTELLRGAAQTNPTCRCRSSMPAAARRRASSGRSWKVHAQPRASAAGHGLRRPQHRPPRRPVTTGTGSARSTCSAS